MQPSLTLEPALARPAATRLGVLLFLVTDGVSFATLLLVYAFLRAGSDGVPARRLSLALGAGMTALLFASSLAMRAADRAARAEKRRASSGWLWASTLAGLVFLGAQAYEYHHLIAGGVMRPASDRLSASFFACTGFHGAHVLAGVVLLALVAWRASADAVAAVALYIYFVDAVWLLLFAAFYFG
jgi:heme/copper-type cytochrome/quinol oxidase subunit 3